MLLVPFTLQQSPIHGMGVFAAGFIPKGTVVWQFDPGIDRHHPVEWVALQPPHVRNFIASYAVLSLDGQSYTLTGDQTLFINHSASPTMVANPAIQANGEEVVVAARDIQPGEELTIDYAAIDGADREKAKRGQPLFPPANPGERP